MYDACGSEGADVLVLSRCNLPELRRVDALTIRHEMAKFVQCASRRFCLKLDNSVCETQGTLVADC